MRARAWTRRRGEAGRRLPRDTTEFGRVCNFSDAVFAIAMTLLVTGIEIPRTPAQDVGEAIADDWDAIVSFAVSFAVIGSYWLGHHELFGRLAHLDGWLVRTNLAYLGLIAFLPFPTALFGRYDGEPVAVALYAAALAVASGVETLMLRHARAAGALAQDMSDRVFREVMWASLVPVAVFAASIALAFAHPAAAIAAWLSIFGFEWLLDRRRSDEAVAWVRGP